MRYETASQMFAYAKNRIEFSGTAKCFYCGGSCNEIENAKEYITSTCNIRHLVACPSSKNVCEGCIAAFDQKADVPVYGEDVPRPNSRMQLYSWIITEDGVTAYTKAHLQILREILLNPPEPPYVIALTESGKKHTLYLTPINYDTREITISLETERISYSKEALSKALISAMAMAAACGKPTLGESIGSRHYFMCEELYGNIDAADAWSVYSGTGLGRLAAFLCPKREDCKDELERIGVQ